VKKEHKNGTKRKKKMKTKWTQSDVKRVHSVYILEKTQTEIFTDFKSRYPDIKTPPHHPHPNQNQVTQTQIMGKKDEKEDAKRSFQR